MENFLGRRLFYLESLVEVDSWFFIRLLDLFALDEF